MKTLTLSLDLKSFFLGALSAGSLLVMVDFKPADKPATEPTDQVRRYQAVTSERETIILDTKTGPFINHGNYLGQPRWSKNDFDAVQQTGKR